MLLADDALCALLLVSEIRVKRVSEGVSKAADDDLMDFLRVEVHVVLISRELPLFFELCKQALDDVADLRGRTE